MMGKGVGLGERTESLAGSRHDVGDAAGRGVEAADVGAGAPWLRVADSAAGATVGFAEASERADNDAVSEVGDTQGVWALSPVPAFGGGGGDEFG